ncbi:hypothetical protein FNH05_26460 [Amycolatopsis rhizosphaerae]|uniref:DUF4386 domain-containing protein n=1 Tax=Amycolatopsis rhizosphaerae TaxID=2053003 RepID=A0A558BE97_9PSEU|nr:hypothetical protein [Amycolatopsis rhizosphaerae]TVT34830.1 hypothetical protein FNH05_26460 [Amycolatopsis rhizosphaerae]
MPIPEISPRARSGALAAACYVLFFVASLVLPGLLGQTRGASVVTPYSTDAEVARYLATAGHGTVPVAAFCQAMSALALLVFAGFAADYAHRAGCGAHAALARAAGTVAAAFLLLSASVQWILSLPATGNDLPVYRAVMDLSFITGAAGQVATTGILVGAVAAAARTATSLPRWLNWLGLAVATLSALSMLSLLWKAATPLLPVGRYLGMIWFLGLTAALSRRSVPAGGIEAPEARR